MATQTIPCLIVGAGPTGLTLAAQLRSFGIDFRVIDRSLERAHESRALAVQARTLEVLDSLGVSDEMVARGNTSARLVMHFGARAAASVELGGMAATDTRYPFILFISQAETERLLNEHLAAHDVSVERGVELVKFEVSEQHVDCLLRHGDGSEEHVRAAYLIGCDGAHSAVRRGAAFSFEGGAYPEDFLLGDVEADGPLEQHAINSFVGGGGVAMFFPLGSPATWRVIAMQARTAGSEEQAADSAQAPSSPLTLEALQRVVDLPTEGSTVVRDAVWLSRFRLHHRQVGRYRQGRVFLAGDAAHVHSPVGAQGMNTGIQDAWNLGWKLALVLRGAASESLLETYHAERWPVGRLLLRYTDRVFSTFTRAMSGGRVASWIRHVIVPEIMPRVLASPRLRAEAFNFVSELRIHYRRSPLANEGRPPLRSGPRAGDRFPDLEVTRDGRATFLQRAVGGAHFSLLLCGPVTARDAEQLAALERFHGGLLKVFCLTNTAGPGRLVYAGDARPLGGDGELAQYLVRPDGYVAYRAGDHQLGGASRYLARWAPKR